MPAPAKWNPCAWKITFWAAVFLVSVPLLIMTTGCSPRPRNQYAQDLVSTVDGICTNLEQYSKSAFGGSEAPQDPRSHATAVGAGLQKLIDSMETISFQIFMDITDEKGYEEWATRANTVLRQKADKCLELVSQIKREYKKNPDAVAYRAASPAHASPVVWLTPKDELVFSVSGNKGLMIEHVLRQDFRARLDAIHRRQIKQ